MKKYLLLVQCLTIFNVINVIAQKMPSDYFDEGVKYAEERNYVKALECFQFIVDNHPKNELYARSLYNLGFTYYQLKDYNRALMVFRSILVSTFNEKEALGGGIMDDPYTNYRHRSAQIICEIYTDTKKYDSALHFLALSDTAFPYLHFCGNEYAANDVSMALKYSFLYNKLGEKQKAVSALLKAVFIELADNREVIKQLKFLLQNDTYKNLKQQLDESLTNIYSRTIQDTKKVYTKYYIKFLQTDIDIPYGFSDDQFDGKKALSEIRNTTFYRMICNL
jgi:tetratricopeptide (TPR) repeat protein